MHAAEMGCKVRIAARASIAEEGEPAQVVIVPVTMHWVWAPLGLLLLLPVPALLGSLAIPDASYPLLFGQPNFLDARARLVAVSYVAVIMLIFAFIVPMRSRSVANITLDARSILWLKRTVAALSTITFAAYAIWAGNALMRGLRIDTVVSLLAGDAGAGFVLRAAYFENIGGVTTWMQLGALVAPLIVLRGKATSLSSRRLLVWLFLLAFARALLNSERLALIEIALSTALAYLILRPQAPRAFRSFATTILLIICSWIGLILVFGAFEYFRSWTYAQQNFDGGFWLYVTTLLLGYYATALNLAAFDAMVLNGENLPALLFQGNLYEAFLGPSPTSGLQRFYGLETFTNRSGVLVPEVAFGVIGGGVVLALTATVIAVLARQTARGHVVAFAVYCASAVAVLELVRIYYFGSSRFLPVLIASTFIAISWSLMKTRSRRATSQRIRRRAPA